MDGVARRHRGSCQVVALTFLCGCGVSGASQATYLHYDRMGSVVLKTHQGTPSLQSAYRPFGSERSSPAKNSDYGFVGKQHDEDTGLSDFGVRYYDSVRGRWISTDPITSQDPAKSLQVDPWSGTYVYGANEPTLMTDPSGRYIYAVFHGDSSKAQLTQALEYILQAEVNQKAIAKFIDSKGQHIEIHVLGAGTHSYYDDDNEPNEATELGMRRENTHVLAWNADEGLDFGPGEGSMSSAEILGHELGHARGFSDDADENLIQQEWKQADQLGLGPTRKTYKTPGRFLKTNSVDERPDKDKAGPFVKESDASLGARENLAAEQIGHNTINNRERVRITQASTKSVSMKAAPVESGE